MGDSLKQRMHMTIKWDMAGVVIGLLGSALAAGMWISNAQNSTEDIADDIESIEDKLKLFALKSEIPDISQLATKTSIAPILGINYEGFAKKSDLPDISQLATMASITPMLEMNYDVFAKKSDLPDTSYFVARADVIDLVNQNIPDSIPKNLIGFFATAQCPSGWTPEDNARGRYIVAVNAPGKVGAMVGEALGDQESRPTGQHTHPFVDRYNKHDAADGYLDGGGSSGSAPFPKTTSKVIDAVDDTNAPYIQLLACRKI